MVKRILGLGLMLVLLLVSASWGQFPQMISFSGKLLDQSGVPVTEPTTITFSFTDRNGATLGPSWSETDVVDPDEDGVITTVLGSSQNPIPPEIFTYSDVHLQIVALGETHRTEMTAAPYAFRATVADLALNVVEMVPKIGGGGLPQVLSVNPDASAFSNTTKLGGPLRVSVANADIAVRSENNKPSGFGVWSYATATSGTNYGGFFRADGDSGVGVLAMVNHDTGTNYAIFGETESPNGYAGFFRGRVAVDGNLGIGERNPQNKLDVGGGAVIGTTYSGINTAPNNGLLVEGRVGIGKTNPEEKLHVAGDIRLQNNGRILADGAGYLELGNLNDGTIMVRGDNVNSDVQAYFNHLRLGWFEPSKKKRDIQFFGRNVVREENIDEENTFMTIKGGSGNVGIGTTSPQNKLDVGGGAVIGTTYSGINTAPGNGLLVQGKVGIGTPNPGLTRVHIVNNTNSYVGLTVASNSNSEAAIVGENVYENATGPSVGVKGISKSGVGVSGLTHSEGDYAGYFHNIYGKNAPGIGAHGYAYAAGGFLTELPDIAEWIKVSETDIKAGDVVVIDEQNTMSVKKSDRSYSTTAAGIISTSPGVLTGFTEPDDSKEILGSTREEMRAKGYRMLALAGRVPCNVSAENGPIQVGDLLTTSATPGHAMKVTDKMAAMGAVVGKALEPLSSGRGKIMVLVTLQ